MGTWGDGLYDNDGALDHLAELVKLVDDDARDAARMVAQIGLLAWFNPVSVALDDGDLEDRVAALADLEQLPEETRAALRELLADPEAASKHGARTPEARLAIGGYSDGPRIDALLRFPGAEPVLDGLGQRAAQRLDRVLGASNDRRIDLYEIAGDMAALGVLIELKQAGLWTPARARVVAWRAGFDAIDRATKSERGFWWKYVRSARRGFDLLVPEPLIVASKRPVTRARPVPAKPGAQAPVQRFTHPKFGAATLLARSASGEALELRFDDGVVRKVLARFVEAIDE